MANLIEPSSFDLIVMGTGLPQCIVAAAAASNGHSVLHLDTCDFYGSHWASLSFQDFSDWCLSEGQLPFPSSVQVPASLGMYGTQVEEIAHHHSSVNSESTSLQTRDPTVETIDQNETTPHANDTSLASSDTVTGMAEISRGGENNGEAWVDNPSQRQDDFFLSNGSMLPESAVSTDEQASNHSSPFLSTSTMEELGFEPVSVEDGTSMYRNFHFMQSSVESLNLSRSFCIDLAGPKLAYCGGTLVDVLLRCGASNYLEFKSLEASFMWSTTGLLPVPSSRADVFKDRTLNNAEKRHLMRFFKLVVDHAASNSDVSQISQEELQSPFVEFLQGRQVPSSVQAMILYAIALSSSKQDSTENGGTPIMNTKEGMENLALYLSSVGRFVNSTGAFLYPLYGQGELPQAFSRSAAVKGALYALKMPVKSLLKDKETGQFKGVQMTTTNQLIFSQKLVAGPTMFSTLCKGFSSDIGVDNGGVRQELDQCGESQKVVRGVCITDKSLRPDLCTIMVVFPPHSITSTENGVIRALQLGSSVCVCPEGKYLVQLSMVCSNESAGIEALQLATQFLFHLQDSSSAAEEEKPNLLWRAFYAHDGIYSQGLKWILEGHVATFGMPDETLHFQNAVAAAESAYKELYPEDVFFLRQSLPVEENTGVDEMDDRLEDNDNNAV